ncbi:MAG: deoxyhypusine synthase [Desulfurococcales archaeon]|nr:deoxyhypusine synthase [Desulfurococcales archaeon]
MEKVKDYTPSEDKTLEDLLASYNDIHGFMAGHLATAIEILSKALPSSQLRILTFTGNLVSTGLRGVFTELIRRKLFNIVITTTGALDHDIARAEGGTYLKGFFEADDARLYEEGYHRLGNIFIPIESYGPKVEGFVRRLLEHLPENKKKWGIHELLYEAGKQINDRNSFLKAAYEAGALVFVPGWPDGAFGTSLFMEVQRTGRDLVIDYFIDMKKLSDIFFTSMKGTATALIIGGGISKHHAIWWSQFREGLDYTVYITTACEYDGSLSGAHPREAISWGKIKPESRKTVVYGDATIIMPILATALIKRIGSL